ncbi:MAG: tRNA (N(6)-L-threonylcarbamoyladenosine(37)-C(2))-methylthiotransferase MtaB [Thermodesulfovibrionales bacterium]|nr:tRNA (N(6)-L-threonylcarbamoyladenosine(37)-C(2))-methylthiotransferase MtaB [Thermodesulfovibrionales bacterium]
MRVSVLTLGCRVNQSESDIIEGNLKRLGWSIVGLSELPDYCIVNTCTVTAKSDYQSRQLIRRAIRAGAKVIVTGCYSQLRYDEIRNISGIINIVDNSKKLSIIKMLSNNIESITFSHSSRSRPYLKIQDGCNFACTYCAVPMARGRSRSLEVSEVIKQAREIEAAGYNEIVLTGINLGSYGYDLKPKTKLSELLKSLLKTTKIQRIRLSSLGVKEVDYGLIELLQEGRICKHIHLPLQSGDDTVLKLMNRMYSSRDYLSTVKNILKKVPDIAIGTDVIVGFPGEGDREFKNTKKFLDSVPITYMHIFPFSPRPNTLASKMANQNTSVLKRERLNELKALNFRKKMAYMLSQINKTLDIIIEEQGRNNISIGTSSNYLKVKMTSKGYPERALVRVRISGIEENFLKGDSVENL